MITPVDAHAREISSIASTYEMWSNPAPPWASGTAMPRKPSSAIRLTSSAGWRCSRSISAAFGRTSLVANSRAVRWTASCSSVGARSMSLPLELRGAPRLGQERRHALALVLRSRTRGQSSAARARARGRAPPTGPRWTRRLTSATASGPLAAIRPATSRAFAISSPAGHTASARPIRSASAASIMSPVMHSSLALAMPTRRASRWVPPNPGMTPSLTSGWPNLRLVRRVDEVARQRQLAAAAEREPVDRRDPRLLRGLDRAGRARRPSPRTPGPGAATDRASRRCRRRRRTPCPRRSAITARTSVDTSSSPHAAVSSAITLDDSALSAASREIVTIASAPSISSLMVSNVS